MTYIPENLRQLVIKRANHCCEYGLINQEDVFQSHEIDHIYAEKHEGETHESNLCLSCMICNRHKGSDIASFDRETGEITSLFHPRLHKWEEHFQLNGAIIIPLTPEGRVTVRLLHLNDDERVIERQQLIELGRYPQK